MAPRAFPARSAANVPTQLASVTFTFADATPQEAATVSITTSEGTTVPISQVTMSTNTVTLALADELTPGTTYLVKDVPNWDNTRFDWTFTTAPPALHVGASVLVSQ